MIAKRPGREASGGIAAITRAMDLVVRAADRIIVSTARAAVSGYPSVERSSRGSGSANCSPPAEGAWDLAKCLFEQVAY